MLSAHLEALQQHRRILHSTPSSLPFYLRQKSDNDDDKKITVRLIKVAITKTTDTKAVVKSILEACKLPTEYIDQVKSTYTSTYNSTSAHKSKSRSNDDEATFDSEFDIFQYRVRKARENESLQ